MNNNLEQDILKAFSEGIRSEEIACKFNLSISSVTKLKKKLGINNIDLVLYKIQLKDFIFFSLIKDIKNKFKEFNFNNDFKKEDIKIDIIFSKSISKTEYRKVLNRLNKEKRFNIINDFIFLEKEEDLINYFNEL